ncbi:RraA family protein [Paenibacillus amylolyticus]|uniref:RraA family protein n=1 Tax=Paenibacillus amylolyticus TaxID=1451 RepID=UPI003EBD0B8D
MDIFQYTDSDAFKGISTACISDALDTFGINGGLEGLKPLSSGMALAGPAYTLQYEPIAEGEVAQAGEFIDEVPEGCVVVIANGGRQYCTVWGDLLTHFAKIKGLRGTVIDGCCRDVTSILQTGYPLFSLSSYMKSGKNRVKLVAKQEPVTINNIVVCPGDIVVADDSGVIVIPKDMVEQVFQRVKEIEAMEEQILLDLQNGMSMKEARTKHRYNRYALRVNV